MKGDEFTLDNGAGLSLTAINRGGIVTALRVPDREGRIANVVLGLPTLADYGRPHPHLGTIVGRYANRIAHGRFSIAGEKFDLPANDGAHTLHGGLEGFGTRWWDITPLPPAAAWPWSCGSPAKTATRAFRAVWTCVSGTR
jgi:aldose 1-epimerase